MARVIETDSDHACGCCGATLDFAGMDLAMCQPASRNVDHYGAPWFPEGEPATAPFLHSNSIGSFRAQDRSCHLMQEGKRKVTLDGQRFDPDDPMLGFTPCFSAAAADRSFAPLPL